MKLLDRLPIKVLDKYLVRGFTYSYVICVVIMISLYIVLDLFANIDEFTSLGKSTGQVISDIVTYYFYHGFLYFAQVAGMITLVAASFTLARLHRSNEMTAMLAGGISLHRVALPLIVAGMVFNGLWVIDQEVIIPRLADKLVLEHDEVGGKQAFTLGFLRDRGESLLTAKRYVPRDKSIDDLLVIERDEKGQLVGKISADQAIWDADREVWKLDRGFRQVPNVTNDFKVGGHVERELLDEYKSDWRPDDLLLRQAAGWTWFLSLGELNALLQKPHLVPNIREVDAARHVRLTQPLVNILLLLLGLPFFLNREPHNVLLSVGMCLLLAITCFMVAFISQTVAATTGDPRLAAWLPIILFGPVATYLMLNIKT